MMHFTVSVHIEDNSLQEYEVNTVDLEIRLVQMLWRKALMSPEPSAGSFSLVPPGAFKTSKTDHEEKSHL